MNQRLGFVVSLLACSVSASLQAASLDAKQLAGPPSEFAEMQSPRPERSAVFSKSALLPVAMSKRAAGGFEFRTELPVESESLNVLAFSKAGANWTLNLRDPLGSKAQQGGARAASRQPAPFGLGGATFPAQRFGYKALQQGRYQLSIESADGSNGFILVEGGGKARLMAHQTDFNQRVGERIGFVASAFDAESFDARVRIDQSLLRVTDPKGQVSEIAMFDDGMHNDGIAMDGLFGADFAADAAGAYTAQVISRGVDAEGKAFVRSAEFAVPVVADSMMISAPRIAGKRLDDRRIGLDLPVFAGKKNGHYRVHAEVWGKAQDGRDAPVAWIGGMSALEQGKLPLSLDARWIAHAKVVGPFTLRNVRVEDPDHFITLAKAAVLPVDIDVLPKSAQAAQVEIDEEMRVGPRPQGFSAKGVGSRLLLVHGYCSGNAWGPIAGQFANSSVFQDFNQNRSHDQFANLIKNFGATWNSFGVVAHSQGGAASLHLYTYYWSGLDNATGARLIQSVGTPYQGTALAGNAAVLGSIFGVGCGTNSNLTYSGASSWLAGIPTWARAKVNFYTTSFTDRSWVYDYCNVATDVLLTDPEDGTTEKAKGQLSGAVNQGHKTGWCHTSGMRDPAQVTDSSRNSIMNSNAAR